MRDSPHSQVLKFSKNEGAGLATLDRLRSRWKASYFYTVKSWRANWPDPHTFFKTPHGINSKKSLYPFEVSAKLVTLSVVGDSWYS